MTTIVLAAGLSSRMGENKLLLEYDGSTIIEHTLKKILSVSDRAIIVVGYERDKIKASLYKYDVEFIENKDYLSGQRSSTIKGIENVYDDDFAVIPGDLPLITEKDILGTFRLLDQYPISRAVYSSIPGHPVAYRKENRERILSFPGSMKEYLKTTNVGVYNGSIGTIFDIDTPDKYKILLSGNLDLSAIQ